MKNYILIFFIFLFLLPKDLFSQDRKRSNFQVHANYLNVKGKQRKGINSGIGIGAEYHFPVVKSIGLDVVGGIGYERLLNCSLCDSEWFVNGYWAGIGLSKRFHIKDKHKFMTQIRYRRVGFERMGAEIIDPDGTIVRWQKYTSDQELIGFRFGYFLPIKVPLVLSYTYEHGNFHWLNTLSLGFQF
jgi:hypothetical protein